MGQLLEIGSNVKGEMAELIGKMPGEILDAAREYQPSTSCPSTVSVMIQMQHCEHFLAGKTQC